MKKSKFCTKINNFTTFILALHKRNNNDNIFENTSLIGSKFCQYKLGIAITVDCSYIINYVINVI